MARNTNILSFDVAKSQGASHSSRVSRFEETPGHYLERPSQSTFDPTPKTAYGHGSAAAGRPYGTTYNPLDGGPRRAPRTHAESRDVMRGTTRFAQSDRAAAVKPRAQRVSAAGRMPGWLEESYGRGASGGTGADGRTSRSAHRFADDHVSTRRNGSFANSGTSAGTGTGRNVRRHTAGAGERDAAENGHASRGFSNGWAEDVTGSGHNRAARASERRPRRDAGRYDGFDGFDGHDGFTGHDGFDGHDHERGFDADQGDERARSRQEKPGLVSRFVRGRKSRKADRQFDRAYGQAERTAPEPVSRAAVYEMRMGSTHKRATQMQRNASEGSGRATGRRRNPQGASSLRNRLLACVAVVVFAVAMVYQPVANYYNETRSLQQLQAEYAILLEHNQQEQASLDYLSTPEGLEEYAHSELGWVRPDEHVVTVEGIEQPQEQTQDRVVTSVQQGSVPTPATWYSPVLDVIFGYQG